MISRMYDETQEDYKKRLKVQLEEKNNYGTVVGPCGIIIKGFSVIDPIIILKPLFSAQPIFILAQRIFDNIIYETPMKDHEKNGDKLYSINWFKNNISGKYLNKAVN